MPKEERLELVKTMYEVIASPQFQILQHVRLILHRRIGQIAEIRINLQIVGAAQHHILHGFLHRVHKLILHGAAIEKAWEMGIRRYVTEFWYKGSENWREDLRFAHDMMTGLLDRQCR